MVQINELDSAIECKVVRTDNVKNEIEMDEKHPANTRRWCVEVPMPPLIDSKDKTERKILVGVPDPRTVQCFIDANMEYYDHFYTVWAKFLLETQRQKHYALVRTLKRSRIMVKGQPIGIYLVALEIFARNNNDRRQQYHLELGQWDTVTFLTHADPRSGDPIADSVNQYIPNYDFTFDHQDEQSKADVSYWLDHSTDSVNMYCMPSIRGSEVLPIQDRDTFLNSSFAELLECGRRGLLLSEFREMKAYYTAVSLGKSMPFVPKQKATVETTK